MMNTCSRSVILHFTGTALRMWMMFNWKHFFIWLPVRRKPYKLLMGKIIRSMFLPGNCLMETPSSGGSKSAMAIHQPYLRQGYLPFLQISIIPVRPGLWMWMAVTPMGTVRQLIPSVQYSMPMMFQLRTIRYRYR